MIKVKNVSKQFGHKIAVNDLSFSVKKGQVLGFLGPNGAGKSTMMRMVTGYLTPTFGDIEVCGFDVSKKPFDAKKNIGYLPENAPLYDEMTIEDFLVFAAEVRGFFGKEKNKNIDKVVELCHLNSVRHQLIDTISKGYRHRTCLAQSLIHDPDVLILDEPTDGLDPNQKHEVRALIKNMGNDKAIIFSTHILEEVEEACNRAIIIDNGTIVADGTPKELKSKAEDAGSIKLDVSGISEESFLKGLESLDEVGSVEIIEKGDKFLSCLVKPNIDKNKKVSTKSNNSFGATISEYVNKKKGVLEELAVNTGRLDLLFRSLTKTEF